jgi:hypothetical protein
MFRKGNRVLNVQTAILAAALLACPCGMLAQRGAGGGHTGGSLAGGGAMGSAGKATGVSAGDDLKDFHAVLAVQATSQQIIEYASMVKSTEAASAELHTFMEQLGKEITLPELANRSTILDQALERSREANKKFLDGFSEPQKSGLKEITKRLIKADADLVQQTKALDQETASGKAPGPQIDNSAQSLEQALASFHSEQIDLGQEMSIGTASQGQDSAFNLLPVKNSVHFANQPVEITTSGIISKGVADGGQNTFKLELTADMSDLQLNITEVLRSELDLTARCGERIAIQSASLTPQEPASLVAVQLHFERWACFGREPNEMAEGNATLEVKLTPAVDDDGKLRLVAEIGRIDAEGLVGELLRSGSLGDTLRDKVAESVLVAVSEGGDFKAALPPAAQGNATLHQAHFEGTGAGRLIVVLEGEIRVPNEKVTALIGELQGRSAPEETPQATVPR